MIEYPTWDAAIDDWWQRKEAAGVPTRDAKEWADIDLGGFSDAYAAAALRYEAAAVAHSVEPGRNDQLNRSAFALGQLVAAGKLPAATVRDNLAEAARQCGLGLRETENTIKSGFKAAVKKPRLRIVTGQTMINNDAEPTPPPVVENSGVEIDFWTARPVLDHVRRYSLAKMTSPWSVLSIVILRALATAPPNVVLPGVIGGPASLNLFAALVGTSGLGKGASEGTAAECITWPDLYSITVGSGEGIAHQYGRMVKGEDGALIMDWERRSVIFTVSEVDTLAALGRGRQGSTLMTQLRSAYSGEPLGFAYADAAKRIVLPRHSYRLAMVVGVQPERSFVILDEADGGTPQRFIWASTNDQSIVSPAPPLPAPMRFTMPDWSEVDLARLGGYSEIGIPDHVRTEIMDTRAAIVRGDAEVDPLDGHAMLTREKVAFGLSILDGRVAINSEDWDLAGMIMGHSSRTRSMCAVTLTRKSKQAEDAKSATMARRQLMIDDAQRADALTRVSQRLNEHLIKNGRMTFRALRDKTSSRDREYFEDAILRLESLGLIKTITSEHNGRPMREFEAVS